MFKDDVPDPACRPKPTYDLAGMGVVRIFWLRNQAPLKVMIFSKRGDSDE
jgi:hypothetical protein